MTRDEIMQMTPEELRLAIAKARGFEFRKGREWWNIWKDGKRYNHNSYAENMVTMDLPDWPTSIADAWELVEEMGGFEFMKSTSEPTTKYYARVWNPAGYSAWADTAPLAICRAWLLAQEAQP